VTGEAIVVRTVAEITDPDAGRRAFDQRVEAETRPCTVRQMTESERAVYRRPETMRELMARFPREAVVAALRETGSTAAAAKQLHIGGDRLSALLAAYGLQLGYGHSVRAAIEQSDRWALPAGGAE
jgi:DNA-binding NtrC family response regulator